MKTIFSDQCWQCWPKLCRCPASESDIDQMQSDIFLLDRELQRENRRAREFGKELKLLAKTIIEVKNKMLSDGGEDNLPADIFHLSKNASEALSMMDGDRNRDRVHEMYLKIQSAGAEDNA